MRNKCYTCQFRKNIPGDCHSECTHPLAIEIFSVMQVGGRFKITIEDGKEDDLISGDMHGIINGWFMWPFNFDPTWLKSCYLYKEK